MKTITATPTNTYQTSPISAALFAATNGYMFDMKNAGSKNDFIKMSVEGRDGIISWSRNAENKTTSYGQKTNEIVAAFPCFVAGALNFRNCANEANLPKLLSTAGVEVKRQHNYPARDMQALHDKIGLPTQLKDLKELIVKSTLEGNFYGANGFMDLYLHDLDHPAGLPGFKGTLNAGDGTHTKKWNINTWFKHPDQVNGKGLANGWTGSIYIASSIVDGKSVDIGLKIERVGGNEFIYISVVPTSGNIINYNVRNVMDWALNELWDILQGSKKAKALLKTVKQEVIPPHDGMALCGVHLGSEIWWSKKGQVQEVKFKDLEFRVNGTAHFLDGTSTKVSAVDNNPNDKIDEVDEVVPKITTEEKDETEKTEAVALVGSTCEANHSETTQVVTPRLKEIGVEADDVIRTEALVFRTLNNNKVLSPTAGEVTSLGYDNGLVTHESSDPSILLKANRYGRTNVSYTSGGKSYVTEVIVKK